MNENPGRPKLVAPSRLSSDEFSCSSSRCRGRDGFFPNSSSANKLDKETRRCYTHLHTTPAFFVYGEGDDSPAWGGGWFTPRSPLVLLCYVVIRSVFLFPRSSEVNNTRCSSSGWLILEIHKAWACGYWIHGIFRNEYFFSESSSFLNFYRGSCLQPKLSGKK